MAKSSAGKGTAKTVGSVLTKYIGDYNTSKSAVCLELGQNAQSFAKILAGKKRITIELGIQLAKLFGTEQDFWIELQKKEGLAEAKNDAKFQKKLSELKKLPKAEKGAKAPKGAKAAKGAKKPAAKKAGAKKAGRKPRAAAQTTSSSTNGYGNS